MGFIWTGIHWDYGHHLNSSRSRGRGFGEIGTNYNDILMFDKCPVGHLTQPAMVWERNKSNDLLLKLNCLFCAKHIEIVRYIGPVQSENPEPHCQYSRPRHRQRPPGDSARQPGTSGAQTGDQKIMSNLNAWNKLWWREGRNENFFICCDGNFFVAFAYTYTALHSNYGWSSVFFMHSRFSTELKSTFDSVYFQLGSENVSFLSLPSIIPGIFWQLR